MAEARAAIDRSGPGYGDPPLLRQGGHRERRSTEPEDTTRTRKDEEYETHYTAKFQKTPLPQAVTDDEGGKLTAGLRPSAAEEGRPQEKVQRQGFEIVQNLDVLVLQMSFDSSSRVSAC